MFVCFSYPSCKAASDAFKTNPLLHSLCQKYANFLKNTCSDFKEQILLFFKKKNKLLRSFQSGKMFLARRVLALNV